VDAQRALAAGDWPDGEQVRVRMGVHTGSPRIHAGGYVGIDVHRAARIAAAAHGGQVVISDASARLVAQTLPEGVRLRDLGGHRLRDLNLPEHLHQLLIPGARADFPPLRSVGTISSLPVATTPLLGRQAEVVELSTLLLDRDVRLVTLTGPGGSGKTRLAVAAARKVAEGFPDGVYFVPLAAVTTAEVIWSSIGEVLDLPVADRIPPAFFERVARRHALFVLDNLEQMQGADAAVAAMLRAAPDLVVLATSRRPLHLTSEHQYAVSPLALPVADTVVVAEASPAVQLFVERAGAVRAAFALTADNSSDVAAICRHLDGLPLAIELAAARCKLLGPRALLARLDQALDLRGSAADRPTRQQALRDTIDWSYRLLPVQQQTLFRRLGVFAGGFDLDALTAVCADGAIGDGDPVDLVADLVDASLVTVTETDDGEPRFTLLETMRAFALDALAQTDELENARLMHAAHFVDVADRLVRRTVLTSREKLVEDLFGREKDNFREVLAWATSQPDRPESATGSRRELGLALLSKIGWLWIHTDLAQSRQWLEAILPVTDTEETAELGRCLSNYAQVLGVQKDLSRGREMARRSVKILRELADPELPDALMTLGYLELRLEDTRACRRALGDAVTYARRSGDHFYLATTLTELASLEAEEENLDHALDLLREAVRVSEAVGYDYITAQANHEIAVVLWRLGRAREAHLLMSEYLQQWSRLESDLILAAYAEDYGAILADAGLPKFAPLLLAACDTARERLGFPRDAYEERTIAEASAAAQSALTTTEWNDAYARGQRMTVVDALAETVASTTDLQI
jgi:predicted ATPase